MPASAGDTETVLTSVTAPGIHSVSSSSYFSPYSTVTGFQTSLSLCLCVCDLRVQPFAAVNCRDLKDLAVPPRLSILSSDLSRGWEPVLSFGFTDIFFSFF